MHGFLATTFDLQAEFLEMDFLPALFRLGAWDDRSWASRIGLERKLAELEAAVVLMESRRYNARPRSLRLQLVPAASPHGTSLHAKVALTVYDRAIRLIVGSANLTEPGYRKNREAVAVITVTEKNRAEVPVLRDALGGMESMLSDWLTQDARKVIDRAKAIIGDWHESPPNPDNRFQWSGKTTTLWRAFLSQWPVGEQVRKLTVLSPFWSEEAGTTVRAFLNELKRSNALSPNAEVVLMTEVSVDAKNRHRPVLPPSYATLDWKALGVRVSAQAVSGQVLPGELGGMEGFTGTRPLHAKIVIMEGSRTGLAYLGSANFTAHGWGFLHNESSANIEAGIVIRRRAGSDGLQAILPPLVGDPVLLGFATPTDLCPPETHPDEPPWPAFIKEVLLTAESEDKLRLVIVTEAGACALGWSAFLADVNDQPGAALVLTNETNDPAKTNFHVPLTPDVLHQLLLEQEVTVRWCDCPVGRQVPVNVDSDARVSLPISPRDHRINEDSLLSYYQGKISWEDLFPETIPPSLPTWSAGAAPESGVDKSKIQSYQIRAFVEALTGIRNDLKAASQAGAAMRLALLGPVSPVALAKSVLDAVESRQRSPTAAAFQFVEILACLKSVRGLEVSGKLKQSWLDYVDQAHARVLGHLSALECLHPLELAEDGSFARYRRAVLAKRFNRVEA
jgi:hypothetical protein